MLLLALLPSTGQGYRGAAAGLRIFSAMKRRRSFVGCDETAHLSAAERRRSRTGVDGPAAVTRAGRTARGCNGQEKPPSKRVSSKAGVPNTKPQRVPHTGSEPEKARPATTKGWCSVKEKAGEVTDIEDLSSKTFSHGEVEQFRTELLGWYDANHRDLPWRVNPQSTKSKGSGAKDPHVGRNEFAYRVWVSEIMLQQTQVATVIDYFTKWVDRWPTVQHLSRATQEEVNEVWAGLGYYRRARYLLDGAKYVADRLDGQLPETVDELLAIPGVGPYTAAAVSSIAFGQHAAAVDGNVIRVICRLRALDGEWSRKPLSGHIASLAQQLLDPDRPGDCNQAIMELGAVHCAKSGQVACDTCPINEMCWARERSLQEPLVKVSDWPKKAAKIEKRQETARTAVLRIDAEGQLPCYAFVQRPQSGLLAGLWEFPSRTLESPDVGPGSRQEVMDNYLQSLFGTGILTHTAERSELGGFQHLFSHIHLTVTVERIMVKLGPKEWKDLSVRLAEASAHGTKLQLIPLKEFKPSNMSKVVQKVFELEKKGGIPKKNR